jgi:polar amino acid transport system substrate-binding protein
MPLHRLALGRVALILLLFLTPGLAGAVDLYLTEVVPYAYPTDHSGGLDGLNVRIVAELKRRSGQPIEAKVVPSARHVTQFRQEKQAYSISQTDNLTDEDGPILGEVSQYPVVVVTTKGQPLKTYDELIALSADKGLGIMRRLSYAPLGADERIKKVEINTIENGLRMLAAGRVSAVVGSQPAILAAAEKTETTAMLGAMLVINHASHVLRARPEAANSAMSLALAQTLSSMRKDGTIARIISDYQREHKKPM